jgi:hypothetical protein
MTTAAGPDLSTVHLRAERCDLFDEVGAADLIADELRQMIAALRSARRRLRAGEVIRRPIGRPSERRQPREAYEQ